MSISSTITSHSFTFSIRFIWAEGFSVSWCANSQVKVGKREGVGFSVLGVLFRFPGVPEGPLGEFILREGLRWKRKLSAWRVNSFFVWPGLLRFGFEVKKGREGDMVVVS